ncbi:MAG TPA: homocitrate synthase [Chloroflexota bacterium]|jgi:homocitrate synthase
MQQLRIIDSTLREGEQFAQAHFTSAQKRRIARALDAFGVEYIEVTSPAVSSRALADARAIAGLGLRARVLAHVRCHPDDIDAAISAGVHGINLFFGTSAFLRQAGHGRSLAEILDAARASVARVRAAGLEVRFSCEDSFRSSLDDLLPILRAVDAMGVQRIGVADTVGIATPRQVYALVSLLRNELRAEIEFHGHNDSGCAVANAHAAIEAGAGYIDTTVLGIGERNGITSLEGLVARVSASDPALLAAYDLRQLIPLAELVSKITGVAIPFNHSIAGSHAFSHRAGVHLGAVLKDPRSYEAIDPALFGARRTLDLANPLTGRHAVRHRATELGIALTAAQLAGATRAFKERAARRRSSMADLDEAIRAAGALAL